MMKDERKTKKQLVGELAELRQRVAASEALAAERGQAEEALRRARQDWENIFQAIGHPTLILDPQHNVVAANRAAARAIGKTEAELRGKKCYELFHGSDHSPAGCPLQKMLTSGRLETVAMEMEALQGTFLVSCTPVLDDAGRLVRVIHIATDITGRKRTEEALRRRADELAALHQTVLEITAPHELPVLLQAIVERAVSLIGGTGGGLYLCDPQRQEVRCLVSYNTPIDYSGIVLQYGNGAAGLVAQSGELLIVDDYRNWPGRAAVFEQEQPFSALLSAPMIWQGQVTGVIHVLHDAEVRTFNEADLELLTLFANHAAIAVENARLYEEILATVAGLEQRVAQRTRQLAETEARYRQIVESPLVGIWQADAQGRFVFINQRLAEMSGYSQEEAMGISMMAPIAPEQRPWLAERMQKRRAGELPPDVVEAEMVRKDGSRYTALIAPAGLYDSEGTFSGFVGALIDITGRKQLEQKLARQVEEQRRLVNAMAGRELRMIELKEVIRQLRAQLEAAGLSPVADDPLAAGKGE